MNSTLAFLLGVTVGLGIGSYAYDRAAPPEIQVRAARDFVAPPAITVASSGADAKAERLPSIQPRHAAPAPPERLVSGTASTDVTLLETVDSNRMDATPAEPPTELVAEAARDSEVQPSPSQWAQTENTQESELRTESESAAPQTPPPTDASLLPHERL